MTNELFAHDYIIALIEAAKKATKKLKRKKMRRVLIESKRRSELERMLQIKNAENEELRRKLEELEKQAEKYEEVERELERIKTGLISVKKEATKTSHKFNALIKYLGDRGTLKAVVKRIKEITGTDKTEELYTLLEDIAVNADKTVKPENLYLLKPALDAMRSFVANCEKLEKGQQTSLLESSGGPTIDDCNEFKKLFSDFIEKYELTKKNTPFYKKWYYWFMSLSMWKRILIGFLFVVVLFIILLVVFKVGPKVVAALRRALNGDKAVGRKLINVANNVNPRVKNAAFDAAMDAMSRRAALYF